MMLLWHRKHVPPNSSSHTRPGVGVHRGALRA